jgi:hypothetical protein
LMILNYDYLFYVTFDDLCFFSSANFNFNQSLFLKAFIDD